MDSHQAAFICEHIFKNSRDVLCVVMRDGEPQFLCDQEDCILDVDHLHVVGAGHILDRDRTLLEIVDTPGDWQAERKTQKDPWIRSELTPEQTD